MTQSRKTGFSIVELLAVMAIVAICLSLLLPTLKRARDQARKLHCTTTLRTLIATMEVYAADNKSFGPPTYSTSSVEEGWPNWLVGSDANASLPAFTGLDPYFSYRVSRDATDRTYNSKKFYWSARGCPDSPYQVNSPPYAANERILNVYSRTTWLRFDSIKVPSNTALAMESNNLQTFPELWRIGGVNGITTIANLRHQRAGLNIGFVDGHVDFRLFNWSTNLFFSRPITLNGASDAGL